MVFVGRDPVRGRKFSGKEVGKKKNVRGIKVRF